jgi:hypothetical protein
MYQNLFIIQMPDWHHYKGKLLKFISAIVDFIVSCPGGMANIQTVFNICPHAPVFNLCPLWHMLSVTVAALPLMWVFNCRQLSFLSW